MSRLTFRRRSIESNEFQESLAKQKRPIRDLLQLFRFFELDNANRQCLIETPKAENLLNLMAVIKRFPFGLNNDRLEERQQRHLGDQNSRLNLKRWHNK